MTMPAWYISLICSLFAFLIALAKFCIPAWRLYNNSKDHLIKTWIDAGMSMLFIILSTMLIIFSCVKSAEQALQILLSLTGNLLPVYQVSFYVLEEKSCWPYEYKSWLLFLCFSSFPLWTRLLASTPLAFLVGTIVSSILIAKRIGNTQTCKVGLLVCFCADYIVLLVAYFIFLKNYETPKSVPPSKLVPFILWNMGLVVIVLLATCLSLGLYIRNEVDLITSLWVSKISQVATNTDGTHR